MSNTVRVKDLPLYKTDDSNVYVEDPPLLLQPYVSDARNSLKPAYYFVLDSSSTLEKLGRSTWENIQRLQRYFTDENQSAVPKAIAITLGGMGGFLVGMRRGGVVRRVLYSGIGMGMLAAFCYPNQTMDISRTTVQNVQRQWDEFVSSPKPPGQSE